MKLFTQTNKIKAYCNNVIPVETQCGEREA